MGRIHHLWGVNYSCDSGEAVFVPMTDLGRNSYGLVIQEVLAGLKKGSEFLFFEARIGYNVIERIVYRINEGAILERDRTDGGNFK